MLLIIYSPTKSSGPRMSKTGKRIGRPPKKGTLIANSSLGAMASEASTSIDNNTTKDRNTPSSSPEPEDFAAKRRKTGLSSSSSSKRYVIFVYKLKNFLSHKKFHESTFHSKIILG